MISRNKSIKESTKMISEYYKNLYAKGDLHKKTKQRKQTIKKKKRKSSIRKSKKRTNK